MKKTLSNKYMMMGMLAILLIIGGTYANWRWTSEDTTNVAVTIDTVKILYMKGPDITDAILKPTLTKETGITKEIEVKTDRASTPIPTINFYLDINTLPNGLKDGTFKWELSKNNIIINSGNFSTVNQGDTITLTPSPQTVTTTKDKYSLLLYIDGTVDNPDAMQNQPFTFKLRADGNNAGYEEVCGTNPIKPDSVSNTPKLADGMIPIVYDECDNTWVKADTISNWYNYNDKKWANAVMVTEASRAQHMSNPAGTPVPEDDILAYLVWIPRYKYQLFNSGDETSVPEQEIQITFENGTATTGTVSCTTATNGTETCNNATNGNWYTHPAFTFGEDELTGLWIGKFETSHETLSSSTTYGNLGCTNTNCANADGLRIKPNVQSLRYNNISNMFYATRSMSRSSNPYGFNTSEVDTHMMKNIEWGAVAYLTQSKYGRCTSGTCTEASKNNSESFYTGRSMGAPGGSGIKTPTNEYIAQGYYTYDGKCATIHANLPAPCNAGSTGQELTDKTVAYSASTTGNIYGIYDISGGSEDFVMGNMVDASGNFYPNSSGFNGGSVANPESKYYDRYAYGTSNTTHNRGHLGDATKETVKAYGSLTGAWYSDNVIFVNSSSSWFLRGASFSGGGVLAGTFNSQNGSGIAYTTYSWRLALQSK